MMEDVVIIGAGIAGLATALALKRVGIPSLVLERSEELRTTGAALTLSRNAWLALDALGVSHKLASLYDPLLRAIITNVDTGNTREMHLPENATLRSIHRKALLEALAEELPADSIRFSSKFTRIEEQKQDGAPIVVLHMEDGTTIKSKVLIGCDGVHSKVAKWLGLAEPVHSGRAAVRGLAIYPKGHGFKHEVRQFIGHGKRAGLVPLNNNQLYWFLTCTEDETMAQEPEEIQKEITEKYAKEFPQEYIDVVKHVDLSNLSWAPLLLRKPWDVIFGNLSKGNITTAGDAMHPMTPDLGQGGCAALEDAVVLGRHIGNSVIKNGGKIVSEEMGEVLNAYVKERKWRVAMVISGSFLSGWVQQGGDHHRSWMNLFRDSIFYGIFFPKILGAIPSYNCGNLPSVTATSTSTSSSKID